MFQVIPIPAFQDNYIWLLRQSDRAVVVDPGVADPVLRVLHEQGLRLEAILITHHHADHVDGVGALLAALPTTVYAPARENYAFAHTAVAEGDTVDLPGLNARMQVLETPGHTLGHVAYYGANSLFCGDTLFGCGCGRLFEGTPEQLLHSLQRLAALPADTLVYCAHEYTLRNIRFALAMDPDNTALKIRERATIRLRSEHRPSMPSTIGLEIATNPFLRSNRKEIQSAVAGHDATSTFRRLRELRNDY